MLTVRDAQFVGADIMAELAGDIEQPVETVVACGRRHPLAQQRIGTKRGNEVMGGVQGHRDQFSDYGCVTMASWRG